MEWDNSLLHIFYTIHGRINSLDITTSDGFQSLWYFWNKTRLARARVCKPKLRQEKISLMLVELLISCCDANNVGEFGFGLQIFKRI